MEGEEWDGCFEMRGERSELAPKLEKRMVDGKRTFIANWGFFKF